MDQDLEESEALKKATKRERIRFVENEIDLSMTFLMLAKTEAASGETAAVKDLLREGAHRLRHGLPTSWRALHRLKSGSGWPTSTIGFGKLWRRRKRLEPGFSTAEALPDCPRNLH